MSAEYWGQWDRSEIESMQSDDLNLYDDCDEENEKCDEGEFDDDYGQCSECSGSGCDSCLC